MQFGVAVSRAAAMDTTWTTIHLANEALARGHRVRFIEPWDFELDEASNLTARAFAFDPPGPGADGLVEQLQRRIAPRRYLRVDTLDVLLLRATPLQTNLLTFAAIARDLGVEVVNNPDALLRVTHKGWLASLGDVPTPRTRITQSPGTASLFYERAHRPVILKPCRGSGGRDVVRVMPFQPAAFDAAFARLRLRYGHIVVQEYLEDAVHGEKRVVWFDGEPVGAYLRQAAPGEFRHNLKQGATAVHTAITDAERATLATLSPHLQRVGVRLAGIDMIGHHIVEVNCLNPGGTYHTDRLHGTNVAGSIIEGLSRPRGQVG